MCSKVLVVLVCLGIVSGIGGFVFAQAADTAAQETQAINVGNKICPVSGEKISDKMPAVTYEYKGKIYNFCCAMCVEEFKKDPEKYIKKVEEELKSQKLEKLESDTQHTGHHH